MRLRLLAALVLLGFGAVAPGWAQSASASGFASRTTPEVRVRWIVDLKKKLGYDDFDRGQFKSNPWKSEQGIAFLGANEVAVYQVSKAAAPLPGSSTAVSLQVSILDARDGHEIKSLRLPASSESTKLIPTRGGAFLIRTGDTLDLYSAKFDRVASRKLPLSQGLAFEEWQIDVSPSGTQIMLAHQQVTQDSKGKDTDSRADIEVLDSENLKSIKAFSVLNLDEWAAADDAIITAARDNSNSFGVMDFNGKWKALKTSAENSDPSCPYHMEALEHQLFAGHDCDDLVIVSNTGREKFSQKIPGEDVLISVAGADRYLAEATVQPWSSRASISVYDLSKKAQISWVSLEKKTIYYSISPAGMVAAVDGERLKFFEPVLTEAAPNPQQRWTVELEEKYGYEDFDRDTSLLWMRQQDVRFITPEEIAVYQVRHNEQASLVERNSSGGGGNFYLQLEILSAHDGHEIKSLRLPTNAQFSKVIPTHEGKFLARTGDVVNLYSANFEQLVWRSLPLEKIEGAEGWQVDVSPSGASIVLAHQQRFAAKSLLVGEPSTARKDHADIEVLDADTLQPAKKFTVKFLRDNWSAAEHSLVATSPDQANKAFGLLDFDAKWSELKVPWDNPVSACPVQMQALPQDRVAVAGCRFFGVLSNAGQTALTITLENLEISAAAGGAGDFVAVEVDKLQVGKPISAARPSRIEVYDLRTKAKVLTVPLTSDSPYFDVSSQGELAVVEGDHVSLYSTKSN